ncbi:hypothetical protein ABZR65_24090 [Pseudomonas aeruginosa]|uniref:hypothetical protein n=1 Tax=Pseudomonas aeruginosa TaxID=287 RepID=UPI0007A0B17E|nr:hypothetical protein [Pseudomonas aeruginosa]AYK25407.1 hypothetical protein PA34_026085 [Pseudomonas aeruginosa]KYO91965.1 hypothetical protein LL05_00490 [Pseudomonas aeruginosa]MDP5418961.1 hypothetical protein [Pseudomonas aeruginosa]UJC25823.1 hypothetical protein HUK75_24735 [Pseudomonas aeruginosa]HBO4912501.1 hypothetical protein [Pseudomonas aeruginosa]
MNTIRNHIILLGKELYEASGLRAMAAEKIMRESGTTDPDDLFVACEELIGRSRLFESYDDPFNPKPRGLLFGEGCPFDSLEAYIALRQAFGDDWVLQAFEAYFDLGDIACGDHFPREAVEHARQDLQSFIARDAAAVARWLARQLRASGSVSPAA